MQRRPRIAVAGIKKIKCLADEERPALRSECRGVGAAEDLEPLLDIFRKIRVEWLGIRREKVRGVGAHLVKIDEDLRIPASIFRDARLRFLLRSPAPVAVHVDQVMVEPAARPRFVMLEGVGIRVRLRAARADVPLHVPLAAIGIQQRIDHDDQVVENFGGIGIAQQRAGRQHRRLGRRRLVAVHTVREPGDGGGRLRDLGRAGWSCGWSSERDDVRAERVERRTVLRRGDHRQNQRAVLICFTKLMYGY